MRILVAQNMLYVPAVDGMNKATRGLLESLARREHSCRVVAPAVSRRGPRTRAQLHEALARLGIGVASHNGVDIFQYEGVEVHAVQDQSDLRAHVIEQIREFKPTWAMVSSGDPGQVLLEAALKESLGRVIYLVQAPWELPFGPLGTPGNSANTELIREAAGIITTSEYLKKYVERWGGLDATVIHPPVYGPGPFPRLGSFDNEFVTILNPSPLKGISVFLALAERLPEIKFAAAALLSDMREADRAALEKLPNISLLDVNDHLDDLFARTRVLLVPSLRDEAFGHIVIKAMLRGVPVIASDVGGLAEAKLGVD